MFVAISVVALNLPYPRAYIDKSVQLLYFHGFDQALHVFFKGLLEFYLVQFKTYLEFVELLPVLESFLDKTATYTFLNVGLSFTASFLLNDDHLLESLADLLWAECIMISGETLQQLKYLAPI